MSSSLLINSYIEFPAAIPPPPPPGPGTNVPNGVVFSYVDNFNSAVIARVDAPGPSRYAQTATGTITLDVEFLNGNAYGGQFPSAGSTLGQFLDNGVPIPGGRIQGPSFAFNWDTTGVADGTHLIGFQFIDTTWAPGGAPSTFSAYDIILISPRVVIVHNNGFNNGSQLIPIGDPSAFINNRFVPSLIPDFVTYAGGGEPANATHAYPVQVSAPSNSASLRDKSNFYIERAHPFYQNEYEFVSRFYRTTEGGVFVEGYNPQTGISVELAYPNAIKHMPLDGARCNSFVDPYTTFIEHPAGGKLVGVDLGGRIYTLTFAGVATTICGYKSTRTVLSYDYKDATLSEEQLDDSITVIGTISPPDAFDFRGMTDLCFDPRDGTHQTIYVAKPLDNVILKITALETAPVATIYAGQDGVGGYTDGAAASALFRYPGSIIMSAAGILYIADRDNSAIRAVSADGATVSTVVGKQSGKPDPGTAAGRIGFTGDISGTTLNVTMMSFGTIQIGQEFNATDGSFPDAGVRIVSFGSGSGGTGTYTISAPYTIASRGLQLFNIGIYSPPVSQNFTDAYLPFPFVIRFDSSENIVLGEAWSGCVRLVNLGGSTVHRIGAFDRPLPNGPGEPWFWLTVNSAGVCGLIDDIVCFSSDSFGSAEWAWLLSHDGTVSQLYSESNGLYIAEGPAIFEGAINPPAHYPWAVEFSKIEARIWFAGFGNNAIASWRRRVPSDPPFNSSFNIGFNRDVYIAGRSIWGQGTVPNFPQLARPSFWLLRGSFGIGFVGLPTIDDMVAMYPTDGIVPGTPLCAPGTLGWYIQTGAGGLVPRPEISGRDLRNLCYWIRRSSLSGTYPTTVDPGPDDPDTTPPVNSNVAAVRLNDTSIRVVWITDKPTIGYAGAGRVLGNYTVWALESGYGTSHSVIINNLPPPNELGGVYFSVYSKDAPGNHASWTPELV